MEVVGVGVWCWTGRCESLLLATRCTVLPLCLSLLTCLAPHLPAAPRIVSILAHVWVAGNR